MARGEWAERWRALASGDAMIGNSGESKMVGRWRDLAKRIDGGTEERADPLLTFVLARLQPSDSVIDVGSAIGRWTVPIAERVHAVTAIEPVEGMREVLGERLAARGIAKVRVLGTPWLDAAVEPHDVVVAAHSMYTSPDVVAFARKMDACARRTCYMAMRIPPADGIIGDLAEHITGEWNDSTNFLLGYNALLEAGFTPNVVVEPVAVRYWEDASIEAAADRARRHLHITAGAHDALITSTLERRLVRTSAGYRWPDCMRSALVWWEPSHM